MHKPKKAFRPELSLALVLIVNSLITPAQSQPSTLNSVQSVTRSPNSLPESQANEEYAQQIRGVKARAILEQVKPLMQQQDYQKAMQLLEPATKLDPNNLSFNVHNYLGLVYENLNRTDDAIIEYKKMLALQPAAEMGRRNLANMYCKKAKELSETGNIDEAQILLKEAIKLNPTQPMFHNNLGSTMQTKGELDGAIVEYLAALAIDPHMELATLNLAKCYLNIGKFEQSKVYFAKFAEEHPESPKAKEARDRLEYIKNKSGLPEDDNGSPDYFKASTSRGVMKWPQEMMPIKVFIDAGSGVNGFRPAFQESLANALTEWSRASNNKITWRPVATPDDADIVCTFASDNTNFKNHATDPNEQGEVSSYMTFMRDGQKYIKHTSVAIATVNSITGRNLSDGEARNVSLHEIGHALGLIGHSPNYHDIMFFITNPGGGTSERKLSARDVATMNLLYAQYPSQVSSAR